MKGERAKEEPDERRAPGFLDAFGGVPLRALRSGLAALGPSAAPLELRILGRVLLHAALVGVIAGLVGGAFYAVLEVAQRALLGGLAGYAPLRAGGEAFLAGREGAVALVPWVLGVLPALGGLASGLVTSWLAPEAAGGGGDAAIEAYHHGGGLVRGRVIPVKFAAAVAALSTGGAGGREGPTMHIGAAIGSLVGRWLPTSPRERRMLYVAGIAAGLSAVFRTPLGAALLATEMLYKDDFEAEALVPAILASVIAYAVVTAAFGESTLFGDLPRFRFVPSHLPLYAGLAVVIAFFGALFVAALGGVRAALARRGIPAWLRPALGGLAMGALGTALVVGIGYALGDSARGLGVFGGGYGAAQVAMTGAPWLPGGWRLVALLAFLGVAKLAAAALTVGSGAAAGDFAPSLVIGGLLGGAFGHAAALLFPGAHVQPAAFALVGMGTFYGGIAHAPLSALILVSELAGSYGLLVPMMLATGIAFVALRRWALYGAQVLDKSESPAHRDGGVGAIAGVLAARRAREVAVAPEIDPVQEGAPLADLVRAAEPARGQRVCVAVDRRGRPRGLVECALAAELRPDERSWARIADAMVPFVSLGAEATLRDAADLLARAGISQVPLLEGERVVGWVGEHELARAFLPEVEPGPDVAAAS